MHKTASKEKRTHKDDPPKRGRRLEVQILPTNIKKNDQEQKREGLAGVKKSKNPKKKFFSRLRKRKAKLERDKEEIDGEVVDVRLMEIDDDMVVSASASKEDDEDMKLKHVSPTHHTDTANNLNNPDSNNNLQGHLNNDHNITPFNDRNTDFKSDNQPHADAQEGVPLKGNKEARNLSQSEKKALVWKVRKRKFITYLKKLFGFLLSTLGLFIVLFSYTILGGFIFHEIESPNEIITKHGVKSSLKLHVELLWNSTRKLNVLKKKRWSEMALSIIDNYTKVVYKATKNDGWDGKDDSEAELQWSFAGSLLYCVTVITTIGYGHIAPKTDLGRLVTIFYAIFGIPLCLLSITHVGGFMATVFRFLYKNIFCNLCCYCCKMFKKRKLERANIHNHNNNIKASTERRKKGRLSFLKRKVDETTPTKEGLLASQNHNKALITQKTTLNKASATRRLRQSYRTIVKWRRGIHNALFTDDNKNIQVPIYVSLLLIGGYIALGALLFGLWERDWNFLIGSYFCFITLSTIGFGDFVPGTSLDPSSSQEKLVLCTLYLIIGLALLAMCFDLMQEEARSIFLNLAKRIGLLEKKEGVDERSDEFSGGTSLEGVKKCSDDVEEKELEEISCV